LYVVDAEVPASKTGEDCTSDGEGGESDGAVDQEGGERGQGGGGDLKGDQPLLQSEIEVISKEEFFSFTSKAKHQIQTLLEGLNLTTQVVEKLWDALALIERDEKGKDSFTHPFEFKSLVYF